jgi:hypothetical protein
MFPQNAPGVAAPRQTYRNPKSGQMARGYTSDVPPAEVGHTAEGGPIREKTAPIEKSQKAAGHTPSTGEKSYKPEAVAKRLGLNYRGTWEGYYDFQDTEHGGSIYIKKENFSEQALKDKVEAKRKAMRETPAEGKSDLAAKKASDAKKRRMETPDDF